MGVKAHPTPAPQPQAQVRSVGRDGGVCAMGLCPLCCPLQHWPDSECPHLLLRRQRPPWQEEAWVLGRVLSAGQASLGAHISTDPESLRSRPHLNITWWPLLRPSCWALSLTSLPQTTPPPLAPASASRVPLPLILHCMGASVSPATCPRCRVLWGLSPALSSLQSSVSNAACCPALISSLDLSSEIQAPTSAAF